MIDELAKQAAESLGQVSSKETLASFWQEYLSKNGKIPALMKNLRTVAPEERPAMGKIINELKAKVQAEYDAAAEKVKAAELAARKPAAVVSVEACGANALGVCHNAVGLDVTALQARSDVLWEKLRADGVPNIAIGDLGNEIGMGTIADHIKKYVPFTDRGECQCGCGGGILSATRTDNIITATCSDWGCYGLMAALAYLKKDMEILHHEDMESEVMRVAARNGFIDMTGSLLPGIDGFSTRMNVGIVSLMRQCTAYAVRYSHKSDHWFGPVLAKHFFD